MLNRRLDDPRWRGATRVGLGAAGASEAAAFRALHADEGGARFLYLSWIVKADNAASPGVDAVTVGFQRTGGPAFAFQASPYPLAPGTPPIHPLAAAARFDLPATSPQAAPQWLTSHGRVFSGGASLWAILLRVPIRTAAPDVDDAGIFLGTTFKFGFEIVVGLQGGGVVPYRYPQGYTIDPATWDDATVGGAGCGQAVTFGGHQIRSYPPPDHQIRFSAAGPPGPSNDLIAEPTNNTTSVIPGGAIAAEFYIANWGSQPGAPNDASGLWTKLPGGPATNANQIAANGAAASITLPWTVNDVNPPLLQEFRANTRWAHQCLLVELSGGGLVFSPSSAYRNMDFVTASTFARDAQISVRGLPDIGRPQRDVYLLVTTTNMPERIEPQQPPRPEPGPAATATTGIRERRREHGERNGGGEHEYDASVTDFEGFDRLARDLPTYVVHVFHDTGEVTAAGAAVLRPQLPFGFVMAHDGPLHGWRHELTAAGLTPVGPNLFRLRVPAGGEAVVSTRIEALERPDRHSRLVTWLKRLLRRLLAHVRKSLERLLRALRRLLRR